MTITDVFFDQNRVNVYEHTAVHDRFRRVPPVGARQEGERSGGNGGKFEWKSFEVNTNTRAVSRGQNELIGKFKMVAGDLIRIMG